MATACLMALLWLSALALQIVDAGRTTAVERADVAIVLGAAVYGDQPSPVFKERIKHGISLYLQRRAGLLLFTGGYGKDATSAESLVAAGYALKQGVPREAILFETVSHTTRENLNQARRLMSEKRLQTALIVSDPLHLKRAIRMASDMGMRIEGSPTPTSRDRSWSAKAGFLLRELYFYNHYLITGQ